MFLYDFSVPSILPQAACGTVLVCSFIAGNVSCEIVTMPAKAIVQGVGLYWQLSATKFVNIAFSSTDGSQVAGLFHSGMFSGWVGSWRLVTIDNEQYALIAIYATKRGCTLQFDGRLKMDLAAPHYYRNNQPQLANGRCNLLTHIQIIDDVGPTTPASDISDNWTRVHDSDDIP